MKQTGFSKLFLLWIGLGVAVLVAIFAVILNGVEARSRDTQRMLDMTRMAAGFALLYQQKASFIDAATGCGTVGSLAASCTLTDVLPNVAAMKEPGSFPYVVTRVPDKDDFGIRFRLERGYGTLGTGYHILSRTGIQ